MKKTDHSLRLTIVTIIVSIAYIIAAYYFRYTPPILFTVSILLVLFSAPPYHIFHPLTVLTGYYFLFYCLALMFGEYWQSIFTFTRKPEIITSCMNCATFLIGYNVLYRTTKDCTDENIERHDNNVQIDQKHNTPLIHITIAFVLLALYIIMSPHSLSVWLTSPNTAFKDRSGMWYIIFMITLFSGYSLTYGGFLLYTTRGIKKKVPILITYLFVGLLLYLPIMNRPRILFYIIFLSLPVAFFMRFTIKSVTFLLLFFLGSIYISSSLREALPNGQTFFDFLWRYCDVYYWTTVIVEHESVHWFQTSFIGFKKFFIGAGYSADNCYTISQIFTEKYIRDFFTDNIGDRSVYQFPVEVDMYVNAYYVFATPFLAFFFWITGRVYRKAFLTRNLGWMYAATYMLFTIYPACLRGMILEFTMLPNAMICYLTFLMLNKYYISNKSQVVMDETSLTISKNEEPEH